MVKQQSGNTLDKTELGEYKLERSHIKMPLKYKGEDTVRITVTGSNKYQHSYVVPERYAKRIFKAGDIIHVRARHIKYTGVLVILEVLPNSN